MLVLLLLGITLLGAWGYRQAPDLDVLRPEIEAHLRNKLQLDELKLGKLSWHWAGYLWVHAEDFSFASLEKRARLDDGRLDVRIPMWRMLTGEIMPERIHLSGGRLTVDFTAPPNRQTAVPLPTAHIILEDIALSWRYGDSRGLIEQLSLDYDSNRRSLDVYFPGTHISLSLDESMLPHSLDARFSDLHWLPPTLQQHLQGNITGTISLQRTAAKQWRLESKLQAGKPASIRLDKERAFSFTAIHGIALIDMTQAGDLWNNRTPEKIRLQQLQWALGDSNLTGKGRWHHGVLELDITSTQLAMPVMWSWLRPLGGEGWKTWLAGMQSGTASDIAASLSLPWPWRGLPNADNWQAARYTLKADIAHADIALGTSGKSLHDTTAHVNINQDRLHARVTRTHLPQGAGEAAGDILIPWTTLELNIAGQADIDAGRLQAWLQLGDSDTWQWKQAAATVTFSLRWHATEATPRGAQAHFRIRTPWDVTIEQIPLRLTQGTVNWDLQEGLQIEGMQVHSPRLHGTVSLVASQDKHRRWQLKQLRGQAEGDFADIVSHFQLPVAGPAGGFSTSLTYNGRWSGVMDLKHASWDNLLGSHKPAGRTFAVRYEGDTDGKYGTPVVRIARIWNDGDMILVKGSGQISRAGLKIQLTKLETAAFSGKVGIQAPFGNAPWEVDVTASYLNRKALPQTIATRQTVMDKPWALRAQLDRFDWDAASMRQVTIRLASQRGSAGVFKATYIRHGTIDIRDASAIFSLPGSGLVDLRRVSASVEKQHLTLSAILSPNHGEGMQWRGFARVEGDFGHIMKRGHLSDRFMGGQMHLLFSGKGVLLRKQPWWRGLDGRLRLRVNNGRIQAGGTMSRLLAALSISDLPKLFVGKRKDLTGAGLYFERLQMEATMQDNNVRIHQVGMRSSAMDLAGHGSLDLATSHIDLIAVIHPLQNLDVLLGKIPLLRDVLGGASHSLVRKVYRLHGPFSNAVVEKIKPEEAGLASPGIIEHLFTLPDTWFGEQKAEPLTP